MTISDANQKHQALTMLAQSTLGEIAEGFAGWVKPPDVMLPYMIELKSEGMAEQNSDDPAWWRATKAALDGHPYCRKRKMIDVTDADLMKLVKEAYALSKPQGLGLLHYKPGELTDSEAREIVNREPKPSGIAVSMDYVKGRAVKMTVFRKDGRLEIPTRWFDHSPSDLTELLNRIGVSRSVTAPDTAGE